MTVLTPRQIVAELDRHIVGQTNAKRAVAIALRNRWRRKQLPEALRAEVTPKNILMIGPTGVGKTEIARRLASLAAAPFIKVEATKFTEVGYVGRDVDQIMRDLVEVAVALVRERKRAAVRTRAEAAAEDRVLDALVGPGAREGAREAFRRRLREGDLADREIEIDVPDQRSPLGFLELPGLPPGGAGPVNLGDLLSKSMPGRRKTIKVAVKDAYAPLLAEESDKLVDDEQVIAEALQLAETEGIVFIDEIDKIAARANTSGADVSREGVQRDLLPLIEGASVTTKHGVVRTDYVLFIASGAFHVAKPSDLLPELQGRLPIRVELQALGAMDFRRILIEPDASLVRQYTALLATEGVELVFTDEGVAALADIAAEVNASVENIGARRLHTVLEKLLDEVSFSAADTQGERVEITAAFVRERLSALARDVDLSKFIL